MNTDPTNIEPSRSIEDIFAAAKDVPEDGAQTFDHVVDLNPDDPDLFDHTAEHKAKKEYEQDMGVEVPAQPERLTAPFHNPAVLADPVADLNTRMESSFKADYEDVKVVVTADERDRFVTSALHDTEMIFDVEIEGVGAHISVAIPTESFTASSLLVLDKWHDAGAIDKNSNTQLLLSFQQLHVWYQVRSVDRVPVKWSATFLDGVPKLSEMVAFTSVPDNLQAVREMSGPRWRMMAEAVRIAELKYKLCLEAWHDRSFFTGADTA